MMIFKKSLYLSISAYDFLIFSAKTHSSETLGMKLCVFERIHVPDESGIYGHRCSTNQD
jgi:hypothetical protein